MSPLTIEDLHDLRAAMEGPTVDALPDLAAGDRAVRAQRRARGLVLLDAAAEVAEIMREAGACDSPEVWAALVADALEARR